MRLCSSLLEEEQNEREPLDRNELEDEGLDECDDGLDEWELELRLLGGI